MPLFAFMIAEGAAYTKNRWKYAARLIICAIAAMAAWNLLQWDCCEGDLLEWVPNVVFTYALAVIALSLYEMAKDSCLRLLVLAAATVLSYFAKLEYCIAALWLVWAFYYIRTRHCWKFYSGEEAPAMPNWVCYAFYPGHLLIIYLIRCVSSIGS